MEKTVVNGLVIKQINYGEADRILHIFTRNSELSVRLQKVRANTSPIRAARHSSYITANLRSRQGKNMYSLQGASVLESFLTCHMTLKSLRCAIICSILLPRLYRSSSPTGPRSPYF